MTKAPPTYSIHGYGRFPKNTTCCSHLSQVNTPLKEFGFGSLGLKIDDFCKPGFVIQLGREPNRIDILTSITGVSWEDVWKNKTKGIFGNSNIPVYFIGKEQLIKNKLAAGRNQDLTDVQRLLKTKRRNK